MAIAAEPPVASMGSSRKTDAPAEILRHLLVVPARHRGHLVTLEAEVAHLGLRDELEERVEHPEPRAQHRHRDHARRQPPHGRGLERRLDGGLGERQIPRRLRDQEQAHPVGELAEHVARCVPVPERGEDVLHERVADDVHVHGLDRPDPALPHRRRWRASSQYRWASAAPGPCARAPEATDGRPAPTTVASRPRRRRLARPWSARGRPRAGDRARRRPRARACPPSPTAGSTASSARRRPPPSAITDEPDLPGVHPGDDPATARVVTAQLHRRRGEVPIRAAPGGRADRRAPRPCARTARRRRPTRARARPAPAPRRVRGPGRPAPASHARARS